MYAQLSNILDLVADEDAEVAALMAAENIRQSENLPLIPSENIVSTAVAAALSSCFTNKYAEGYPHLWKEGKKVEANGRYYQGQANTNALEKLDITFNFKFTGNNHGVSNKGNVISFNFFH